jgi:hypothetical protein
VRMVNGAGSETMETRDHRPWYLGLTLGLTLDPYPRPWANGLTLGSTRDPGLWSWPWCLGLTLGSTRDPGLWAWPWA